MFDREKKFGEDIFGGEEMFGEDIFGGADVWWWRATTQQLKSEHWHRCCAGTAAFPSFLPVELPNWAGPQNEKWSNRQNISDPTGFIRGKKV